MKVDTTYILQAKSCEPESSKFSSFEDNMPENINDKW